MALFGCVAGLFRYLTENHTEIGGKDEVARRKNRIGIWGSK